MESLAYFLARKFSIGACIFQELGRYSLKPNKIQGWGKKKKKVPVPSKPLQASFSQARAASLVWFLTGQFQVMRTLFTHVDLARSFNFPARD